MEKTTGRIEVIDVLRGFALCGIVYAHFIIWYTGGALPDAVYDKYDGLADNIAMAVFGTLVLGKFFSLFSFLFGYSFFLMKQSKEANHFKRWYGARLLVLGVIGFLHHVVWRGDILLIYALLGVILLPADRLRPSLLLLLGVLLALNVPSALLEFFQRYQSADTVLPMEDDATRYLALLQNGTFTQFLRDNLVIIDSKFHFQISSGRFLITAGFFLLGLWAAKTGWLVKTSVVRIIFSISSMILLSLLVFGGILLMTEVISLPDLRFRPDHRWLLQFLFNTFNAVITLWYVTAVVLAFATPMGERILSPLRHPGRMALTVYLFQTVCGLVIFYPFGLGLFGATSPALNTLLVIPAVWLQVALSRWWLHYFRQGPVEYLWAQLTDRLSHLRVGRRPTPVRERT